MEATQSEEQSSTGAYIKSILSLVKDIPFLLLVLSYGLNVGVYYAISTLLNPIIKPTFYDPVDDKGHSVSMTPDLVINIAGKLSPFSGRFLFEIRRTHWPNGNVYGRCWIGWINGRWNDFR